MWLLQYCSYSKSRNIVLLYINISESFLTRHGAYNVPLDCNQTKNWLSVSPDVTPLFTQFTAAIVHFQQTAKRKWHLDFIRISTDMKAIWTIEPPFFLPIQTCIYSKSIRKINEEVEPSFHFMNHPCCFIYRLICYHHLVLQMSAYLLSINHALPPAVPCY